VQEYDKANLIPRDPIASQTNLADLRLLAARIANLVQTKSPEERAITSQALP